MESKVEIKVNNVYNFKYNEKWSKKVFDPYHCFDGQLIVRQGEEGLYLEDTYWSAGENRCFTLEEAIEKGDLTYVCNLDEVEKCKRTEFDYYDDKDCFNLSTQHNCYGKYYIRKNAKKSQNKIIEVLIEKIKNEENIIRSAEWNIEYYEKQLKKVRSGDLNISI